jgi:hypothetical protein
VAVSATALTTNVWYDRRCHIIKTAAPGGLVTKDQYDGAGRAYLFTSYDAASGGNVAPIGPEVHD